MINVKLVRISTGEEVVTELISEDENSITVKNALVVFTTNQGYQFTPWASVIDKENPEITVSKSYVVYMVDVEKDVVTKYNQLFGSKLELPEEKKLIL
jgi:hypothetical protein